MRLVELPISEIYPYEKNPRNNDGAVDIIVKSIETFDFRKPILIDENHVILAGHTRLKALKKLGRTTAWCIILDNLTEVQKKAYRIADNKIGELSSFDFEILENEFAALQDSGLDLSWFNIEIVDLAEPIAEDIIEEDEEKPKKEKEPPKSEKGKIYKLGNHYLFCGDGSTKEAWKKLLGDRKISVWITDLKNIFQKGKRSNEVFTSKINRLFKLFNTFADEKSSFYLGVEAIEKYCVYLAATMNGFEVKSTLYQVMDKSAKGYTDYRKQADCLLFGSRKNINPFWYGSDETSNVLFFDNEKIKGAKGIVRPVGMYELFLKNSTLENDIVFDCAAGNGSLLIACEQNNRICFAVEQSEYKCDFIRKRYAEYVNGEIENWEDETKEI